MAVHSSYNVPSSQKGRFDCQRFDGSVVINVSSGANFTLSAASLADSGMKKLLGEGLRQNEAIYWTTRPSFDGPEIDQIYCDRINHSWRRCEWVSISFTRLTIIARRPTLRAVMQTMEAAVHTA